MNNNDYHGLFSALLKPKAIWHFHEKARSTILALFDAIIIQQQQLYCTSNGLQEIKVDWKGKRKCCSYFFFYFR